MPKKKTPRRCSRFRCAELKDYICCADCEWRPPLPGGLPERTAMVLHKTASGAFGEGVPGLAAPPQPK